MSSEKEIIKQMQNHLNDYEESLDESFYHGFEKEFIDETKFLTDYSFKNIKLNLKKYQSVFPVKVLLVSFNYYLHIKDKMEALLLYNAIELRSNILFNIQNEIFRHPRCSHSSYPVNAAIKFFDQDNKNSQVLVFLCDNCKKFIEYYIKYHDEYTLKNQLYYSSFHPLNYSSFM